MLPYTYRQTSSSEGAKRKQPVVSKLCTASFQTPKRKGVKKRDKQINGQSNDTPAINKGNRIKDPNKGKREHNIIKGAPKYSSRHFLKQKVSTKYWCTFIQHKIINDFKIITPEYATNSQASTHRILAKFDTNY